jgi:DNA-binding GntR family transcriptional regulator
MSYTHEGLSLVDRIDQQCRAIPPDASHPAAMPPKSNPELSRSEAVYRGVRRAIIEQALMPGDKLPEDIIGERFGVSRTIVRAALARLNAEGLVDLQPNKGAAVAQPSLSEAYDIFEARRCLERQVVQRLSEKITEEDLALLARHLKLEEQARSQDGPAAIRLAGEFHILLAELSGNSVLAKYVDETVSRCSIILALYGRPHSSDCAVNEHQQIVDALRARKAKRAIEVMDHHLDAVSDRALLSAQPNRQRDIRSILGRYAG